MMSLGDAEVWEFTIRALRFMKHRCAPMCKHPPKDGVMSHGVYQVTQPCAVGLQLHDMCAVIKGVLGGSFGSTMLISVICTRKFLFPGKDDST